MRSEYDVTIVEAKLFGSVMSGMPAITLEFSPHRLCFLDDRVVSKLFCSISNVHPKTGWKRTELRGALGMVCCDGPFTDSELSSMIGRRLRVGVEEIEFQGSLRLRVVGFLHYAGEVENPNYSDNEYVFMLRELLQEARVLDGNFRPKDLQADNWAT